MPYKRTKDTSQKPNQLEMFASSQEKASQQTSSLSDSLAKIYQLLENGKGWQVEEAVCSMKRHGLFANCDHALLSLKTSKGYFQATEERTLSMFCEKLPTLGFMTANGNLLIQDGFCPKIENGYILSDILEEEVNQKYFLSEKTFLQIVKYGKD